MRKYNYILCLYCSLFTINVYGQDSPTTKSINRFLYLGTGLTFQNLQDPAVSPMIYAGGPIHFSIGYEKQKQNLISGIELNADFGALSAANATDLRPMRSSFYRFDLQYTYLRRAFKLKNNKYTIWLGGKYLWHNSIRMTPQNDTGFISFLIANSLKATGVLQRQFTFNQRQITFSYGLDIPLLSHVIRPSYLNLYDYLSPENNWVGERMEESRIYTLNKFPGVNSTFELDYPIAGGNVFRVAYQWEFYHLNTTRRVNYARHLLQFSFLAKI